MGSHALLSPSGAERWLTCTPSARFETQFEETESIYADEGTLAHAICELKVRQRIYGVDQQKHIDRLVAEDAKRETPLFNQEMIDIAEEFAEFIAEKFFSIPGAAMLFQEKRINLTHYIPDGFGTVDIAIGADNYLEIVDYKHGKGVPVDAYENSQMLVYALGALLDLGLLFNITHVRVTIYQPRIDNISSYEIPVTDLLRWGNEYLMPQAKIAYAGEGEFVAGDHCRFCRARPVCKAHAVFNLQIAKREFEITEISDEQMVKILLRADNIKKWLTAVEEYALKEAIKGRKWPGLKLVKGRSNRKYTDPEAIIQGLLKEGYSEEQIVNKKIPGISQLQKIVTKLHFKQVVEPHIVKPPGKPTLTVLEDKRPEWNALQSAIDDFSEEAEVVD